MPMYKYACPECHQDKIIICPVSDYKDETTCDICGGVIHRTYGTMKLAIVINDRIEGPGIEVIHHEKNARKKSDKDFTIRKKQRYI
jgi:putative FmdB family regulatory protein